jgi:hypothetical protein
MPLMPMGMIVCAHEERLAYLRELAEKYDPLAIGPWPCARSVDEAIALLQGPERPPLFLLFSLRGRHFDHEDVFRLTAKTELPVLVELDGDHPQEAFKMLGHGAFHVVSSLITHDKKLWSVISKVAAGDPQPIEDPILKEVHVQRSAKNWGFMCMNYESTKVENSDYDFGIKPVMKRLDLDLKRCDRIRTSEAALRVQVQKGIRERLVLVVLVSSCTAWTHYEMGYAHGRKKVSLPLYRESSGERAPGAIPDFLAGDKLTTYCTKTELAMKLFFGLGGTEKDLLPEDRPTPQP